MEALVLALRGAAAVGVLEPDDLEDEIEGIRDRRERGIRIEEHARS